VYKRALSQVPLDDVNMPGDSDGALELQHCISVCLLRSLFYSKLNRLLCYAVLSLLFEKLVFNAGLLYWTRNTIWWAHFRSAWMASARKLRAMIQLNCLYNIL
jgi:hypothetical protein